MRHLRSDYDAIQPWPVMRPHTARVDGVVTEGISEDFVKAAGGEVQPLIPDDEPVFLIRGQDPAAPAAVRAWAKAAADLGTDYDVVARVYQWADEMEEWAERAQHGAPDVPPRALR